MLAMACAASATGCAPMQRGMFGPEASLQTASRILALQADGGMTKCPGAVEFVQGASLAGSVFVIVRVEDQRALDVIEGEAVGKGTYFTFFQPCHLSLLEAPLSIARAHLHGERWLAPLDRPVGDVMTIAKRDLRPGELLDTFGGYTFYGVIDRAEKALASDALPAGLTPGARLVNPVPAGAVVTWNDVALDEGSAVVRLRRLQDAHSMPRSSGH